MKKIEALQGILDLYKEKEKNKELELCLKAEEKYSEGLNRDIKSLLNIEPNENFISKDKINSKIEEYEEILQSPIIKEDYKKEVEHIIRVLKELKGDN